ncbi:hypothetical protein MRB53_038050 [Persea americana]|nr:hypothetical protein MRB53_038050 [Persea americana]
MDSPVYQSPTSHHYPAAHHRGNSNSNSTSYPASASTLRHRAGIHKRSSHPDRSSISLAQPDRLYRWASEQSHQITPSSLPSPAIDGQWITPQQSPQTHGFSLDSTIEPFSTTWGVPTPPRSDSGVPNLSVDATDEPISHAVSAAHAFNSFEHPATTVEMSNSYEADANHSESHLPPSLATTVLMFRAAYQSMDQSYIPPSKRMSQPAASSGISAYASTASSSPDLYQSRHSRAVDGRSLANLDSGYRRVNGHYEGTNYALSSGPTIPPISGLQTQLPLSPCHLVKCIDDAELSRRRAQNQAYATTQPASHLYSTSPPVPQSYMPTSNRRRRPQQAARQRCIKSAAQPATQTPVLGAWVQWAAILDVQQPAAPSAGEIRDGGQVVLSQVRGGIHADDGT